MILVLGTKGPGSPLLFYEIIFKIASYLHKSPQNCHHLSLFLLPTSIKIHQYFYDLFFRIAVYWIKMKYPSWDNFLKIVLGRLGTLCERVWAIKIVRAFKDSSAENL